MSHPASRVRSVEAMASILRRLCFVDIETTGLDPRAEEIVEVGAVFVERGVVTNRQRWLVKPGRSIPALITALTGLTDEEVSQAPPLADVQAALRDALGGWTLVAHNAAFERSFLGELIAGNAMLDSCEVAQLLFPERASHSLDSLVRWLEVGRGARHRALDDAEDTFQVMAALCDRVLQEPASPRLKELLFQLRPGASGDRAALCAFLEALDVAPRAQGSRTTSAGRALSLDDQRLVTRFGTWLRAPTCVGTEIERNDLLPLALAAARLEDEPVAVAVPAPTFRQHAHEGPALPRRAVCSTELRRALGEQGRDELSQFGRAYVSSWLARTPTGDLESISGFVRSRCPDVAEVLDRASRCSCSDPDCFSHRAERELPVVLISHEHALDWLERGAPVKLLILDADRLPEAERRRTQRALYVDALERFGLDITELRAALASMQPGAVVMRARVSAPWLAIREALQNLSHALRASPVTEERTRLLGRIAEVLEPPPPGFETQVSPDGLSRLASRINERVARRLRGGLVLVSSFRGGLGWTRGSAIAVPSEKPVAQLEWMPEPTTLEQLAELVEQQAPVVLVAASPLAPIAEACLKRGLTISLDAERPSAVQLCEWRRDRPPPDGATCVFYGVKEWRRAVLSSQARRVTLLSPTGLPAEPLRRALQGLNPRLVTSPVALPASPAAS